MSAAEARATSEKATSSATTMPAAWSISPWIPLRVAKRSEPIPYELARACSSVTSMRAGSLAQTSAMFTGCP